MMPTLRKLLFAASFVACALSTAHAGLVSISGSKLFVPPPEEGEAFDFYISEAGDDNNDGSLASPWSICALTTKMATYAGQRIGLVGTETIRHCRVGGTTTSLYAMLEAAANEIPVVQIQGGASSAAKTYIGSSDASGNYSPRAALIDATNPSGGAHSTNDSTLFGQHPTGTVSQFGNLSIQGIRVRGGTFVTFMFIGPGADSLAGVHVYDNELYDQLAPSSNDNPGILFFHNGKASDVEAEQNRIYNNYFHDMQTAGGSITPWCVYSAFVFQSQGIYFGNNTTISGLGFYAKDYYQDGLVEYNYVDTGTFGSGTPAGTCPAIRGFISDSGRTTTIRHNIIIGGLMPYGGDALAVVGNYIVDHNTFYQTQNGAWNELWRVTSTARIQRMNNLYYWTGTVTTDPSAIAWLFTPVTGTILTNSNYNGYRSTVNFSPLAYTDDNRSLASWQSFGGYGFDSNSITLSSSPFATTPESGNSSTFAVTGAAATASSTGGPIGANVALVGADWVTPP